MTKEMVLEASARTAGKDLAQMRNSGQLPAVVYGAGNPSQSISISAALFEKILRKTGETGMVELKTPSGTLHTLIHEIMFDPIKHVPVHVDFLAVDVNKVIRVKVPVEFEGEAPAAKQGTGVIVKVLHEIEIEALPKNLPQHILVDISGLAEIGNQIHVSDIKASKEVTIITSSEEVVVAVTAIKEEKEEVVPVDLSTIEISEERGKKPEDTEEGAAAPEAEKEQK